MDAPIAVRSVTVKRDRLICDIIIADERFRFSNPRLAQCATDAFPTLVHHVCVNSNGAPLADVLASTSVPHLLEHIAIDIQTRASTDPLASFVGTSEWLDPSTGVARIELGFSDDLEALRAFTEAAEFLNGAVLTCLA